MTELRRGAVAGKTLVLVRCGGSQRHHAGDPPRWEIRDDKTDKLWHGPFQSERSAREFWDKLLMGAIGASLLAGGKP